MLCRKSTVRRFCMDCGSKLVYYPNLSSANVINENRVLTYSCWICSEKNAKILLISIRRKQVTDPLKTVNKQITKIRKKIKNQKK